jgi:hypothetical protein
MHLGPVAGAKRPISLHLGADGGTQLGPGSGQWSRRYDERAYPWIIEVLAPTTEAEKLEHVVTSCVDEYRRRRGREPVIVDPDVQDASATDVPKTTVRRKRTLH